MITLRSGSLGWRPHRTRSSNLNDEPDDPVEGGQTQSYGQEVKKGNSEPSEVKSGAPSPGAFCNPEKGPFEGPFEEEEPLP